jgi:hypothetical protein
MTKPVKDDINQAVNARWGQSDSFAARAAEATPTSLVQDIVRDASRGIAPRSALPATKREYPPTPAPEPVPSYTEWYFQRYGSVIAEAKAKNWYHTEKTAGRDVGKGPMPQSPIEGAPRNGWVEPQKLGPPPGINILDKLLDHQDRLNRAERTKNGGRW